MHLITNYPLTKLQVELAQLNRFTFNLVEEINRKKKKQNGEFR